MIWASLTASTVLTAITPDFPGCFQDFISQARAAAMGLFAIWAVWQSDFPENELLLISTVVLNVCFFLVNLLKLDSLDEEALGDAAALMGQDDGGKVLIEEMESMESRGLAGVARQS